MKKRNGSVMATTLIYFSILSIICLTCLGLVTSNNEINYINCKSTTLKYILRGGSELVYSKILEEVNKAIELSNKEVDKIKHFKNYFLIDNRYEFILGIEEINEDNIKINVINDKVYIEDNHIRFDVTYEKRENDIKKTSRCSFKINTDIDFENINTESLVMKYNYKEI
ncbi:MAG: hypothetical protein ACRCXT_20445 [Paraclostridium sp.]